MLNITDPYPVALGGAGNIAVDQFIDFLSSPVFTRILSFNSKCWSSRVITMGRYSQGWQGVGVVTGDW